MAGPRRTLTGFADLRGLAAVDTFAGYSVVPSEDTAQPDAHPAAAATAPQAATKRAAIDGFDPKWTCMYEARIRSVA